MNRKINEKNIEFIKNNYLKLSKKEIAKNLNVSIRTITIYIKKYIHEVNLVRPLPNGFLIIKNFPSYAVNCEGKVLNIKTRRYLSPLINKDGYYTVYIANKKHKKRKRISIHRLVASCFLENPENLPEVHHRDSNKVNNHVFNLQWITGEDNILAALEDGLVTNLSRKDILQIYELLKQKVTYKVIAKKFNVSTRTIGRIKTGKSWKHLYHHFKP